MRSKVLFLSVLLASSGAFAADAPAAGHVQDSAYRYGMDLDVAEIIAINEAPHARCELIPTEMTYRDSRGQVQTVSYTKQDMDCE